EQPLGGVPGGGASRTRNLGTSAGSRREPGGERSRAVCSQSSSLDLERREVALAVRPLPRGCRGRDEEIERRDAEQGWTPRPERDRPVQAVVLTGRAEARQSPAASHKGRRLRYLQVRSAWRDESRRGSLCRNP